MKIQDPAMRFEKDTVNVYFADAAALRDPEFYRAAFSVASPDRRAKAERFLKAEDRERSIAAELLLRKALSDAGTDLTEFRYAYGEHEKPALIDAPDFHFSISHSGNFVMVAAAYEEVGCDIERIGRADLRIAERFFSEPEKALLRGLPEEMKNAAFFRLWTLKEAFLKATGQGFSMPLDSFSICFEEDGRISVRETGIPEKYAVSELSAVPGYASAVCFRNETLSMNVKVVDIIEVLNGRICDDHQKK